MVLSLRLPSDRVGVVVFDKFDELGPNKWHEDEEQDDLRFTRENAKALKCTFLASEEI